MPWALSGDHGVKDCVMSDQSTEGDVAETCEGSATIVLQDVGIDWRALPPMTFAESELGEVVDLLVESD